MRFLIHTRGKEQPDWEDRPLELMDIVRLPVVGDYICLGEQQIWHFVQMVVYAAPKSDYVAEIYCLQMCRNEALQRAGLMSP